MIRAVIIGFAHMHVNEIALYITENPDFELVAAAGVDSGIESIGNYRYTPQWNENNIKENYCSNIYDDYKKMLDEEKPDIAFILTENLLKPAVVEECAKRNINVSIEKPIAINYDDAKKLFAIVKKYKIEAVVNWPVMYRPYVHKMMNAIESQIVGKPIKLNYINGHTGPLGKGAKHRGVTEKAQEISDDLRSKTWWHKNEYGGGVYLDISCYGCFFSEWIFKSHPSGIISVGKNLNTPFGDTDDNFAGIIKYDNAMSVIEGTWSTPRAVIPSGPSVLCTNGVICCIGGAENSPDVKAYDIYGNEVKLPEIKFPDKYKNMPYHYANHIINSEPIHPMLTLETNMKIMAMMDSAVKSSKTGSEVSVPNDFN